jgi:hypothetical protein
MRCRNCGHDNGRNSGKCDNCGFRLEPQTEPMNDQRSAIRKPLEDWNSDQNGELPELTPSKKGKAGLLGLVIFIISAAVSVFIVKNFDRAEYVSGDALADTAAVEQEILLDSLPIRLGTDIVYVFNADGTSAAPRTNVDLALIPEGTSVSFLGNSAMSIQPVVNFMQQKINSSDFRALSPDSLYSWVDSTETAYLAIAILKPVPSPDVDSTAIQPVDMKILFTDEWLRCIVEEYNCDIIEPATGYEFNAGTFNRVMEQAERAVTRRNTDQRPVQVTLLFPSESTLGEAVIIAESASVLVDSLGYEGFHIKWVNVTD